MLRTLLAFFNRDAMPCTAAPRSCVPEPSGPDRLRLRWSSRDGRLMSRWHREARDLADEAARIAGCPAA
jgi:hypothetical protein